MILTVIITIRTKAIVRYKNPLVNEFANDVNDVRGKQGASNQIRFNKKNNDEDEQLSNIRAKLERIYKMPNNKETG